MNARITFCIILAIFWLAREGCDRTCDPDSIFHDNIAGGAEWLECGDIQKQDDRTDVAQCLRDQAADGVPAYVRMTSDTGVSYVFVDEEAQFGMLTWAGYVDCVGDNVRQYWDCSTAEAIDALDINEGKGLSIYYESYASLCINGRSP